MTGLGNDLQAIALRNQEGIIGTFMYLPAAQESQYELIR